MGLAIRLDTNKFAPKAPGEKGVIAFGIGVRRKWSAHLFLETKAIAPLYLKRGTNRWEYIGDYIATEVREDKATILKYSDCHSGET